MKELTIIKRKDTAYIDSREVAEVIGKRHDHLLRDIAGYLKIIEKFNHPNLGGVDFFLENTYLDAKGEKRLCYLISKMGCELVANKLIGEKGIIFTIAYVAKFNEMEAAERERQIIAQSKPRLSEFNSAVRNVLSGMSYTDTAPQKVMDFLRGVYEPLGIKVGADDMCGFYHNVTQIARSIGIYSDTGRPHGHAISAIIAKLNMPVAEHAIVVPYGLRGVSLCYDLNVNIAVCEWLIENRCPSEIPHLGFEYHVNYYTTPEYADEPDFDNAPAEYTAEELDELCDKFDDCGDCPGLYVCCNEE